MPSTVNGIGTAQYGKKNLTSRVDTCSLCHRSATLESYDTREYVVILFIPIIPLARYHNMDHCSSCRRWKQMPLEKWEELKTTSLTKALEDFAANPGDFKPAIQLYSHYLFFQKKTDADRILLHIRETFGNEPDAMTYAGHAYWESKRFNEARECFERVLALQPANVHTQRCIIGTLADAGRFDEALPLLNARAPFAKTEEAGLAYHVCKALGKANWHVDALDVAQKLREANPAIVKDVEFRKLVIKSEKALNLPTSLPPPPFSWSRNVLVPGLIGLAVIGFFGGNYYQSQHRTLHILSAFPKPVDVLVDGVSYQVPRDGERTATVAEGSHHIKVLGDAPDEFDISVQSGYFARFFSSPAYIVNIGGSVALEYATIVYSTPTPPPLTPTLRIGERFVTYPDVYYLLETPPPSIRTESHRVERTYLIREQATPEQIIGALAGKGKFAEAYDLTLAHLKFHPAQPAVLLSIAVNLSGTYGKPESLHAFLKEQCKRRPLEVEWHRAYQTLTFAMGKGASLAAEYDAILSAQPNDPEALYLRLRLSDSLKSQNEYATKALANNPKYVQAHVSLSFAALSRGDWAEARKESELALKYDPKNDRAIEYRFIARVAGGDWKLLEATARMQTAGTTPEPGAVLKMITVLAAQKKFAELRQFVLEMRAKASKPRSDEAEIFWGDYQEELAAYFTGQTDEQAKAKTTTSFQVSYLIQTGKLDAAAAAVDSRGADFCTLMVLSQAFGHAKNVSKCDDYHRSAVGTLMALDAGNARMAAILESPEIPSIDEIMDIPMNATDKALCLISLADKNPDMKTAFLEVAQKLNAYPKFPSREIDNAIQLRLKK